MNLLMMLELANRPWVIIPDPPKPDRRPRKNGNPDHQVANAARHSQTVAKYKAVAGTEWIAPTLLAKKLKMDRSCVSECLRKWYRQGLVEKRNFNNAENYNHRQGYEFRFIKDEK